MYRGNCSGVALHVCGSSRIAEIRNEVRNNIKKGGRGGKVAEEVQRICGVGGLSDRGALVWIQRPRGTGTQLRVLVCLPADVVARFSPSGLTKLAVFNNSSM